MFLNLIDTLPVVLRFKTVVLEADKPRTYCAKLQQLTEDLPLQ